MPGFRRNNLKKSRASQRKGIVLQQGSDGLANHNHTEARSLFSHKQHRTFNSYLVPPSVKKVVFKWTSVSWESVLRTEVKPSWCFRQNKCRGCCLCCSCHSIWGKKEETPFEAQLGSTWPTALDQQSDDHKVLAQDQKIGLKNNFNWKMKRKKERLWTSVTSNDGASTRAKLMC